MDTIILALIYKMYGYQFGRVTKLGTGMPSEVALNSHGFPWPSGTEFERNGHNFRAEDTEVIQLDSE